MRDVSRESDEMILGWVKARCRGHQAKEIAAGASYSLGTVIRVTTGVLVADLAEIKREPDEVPQSALAAELVDHSRKYWSRKSGGDT